MAKDRQTLNTVRINGVDYVIGQRWFTQTTLFEVLKAAYFDTSFQKEIGFADTTDYGTIAILCAELGYSSGILSNAYYNFISRGQLYRVHVTQSGTSNIVLTQPTKLKSDAVDVNFDSSSTAEWYVVNSQNIKAVYDSTATVFEGYTAWTSKNGTFYLEKTFPITKGESGSYTIYENDNGTLSASGGSVMTFNANFDASTVQAIIEQIINNGASVFKYDNSQSGLDANNVQDAIDETQRKIIEKYNDIVDDTLLHEEYFNLVSTTAEGVKKEIIIPLTNEETITFITKNMVATNYQTQLILKFYDNTETQVGETKSTWFPDGADASRNYKWVLTVPAGAVKISFEARLYGNYSLVFNAYFFKGDTDTREIKLDSDILIPFNNEKSKLESTDVQGVIDEVFKTNIVFKEENISVIGEESRTIKAFDISGIIENELYEISYKNQVGTGYIQVNFYTSEYETNPYVAPIGQFELITATYEHITVKAPVGSVFMRVNAIATTANVATTWDKIEVLVPQDLDYGINYIDEKIKVKPKNLTFVKDNLFYEQVDFYFTIPEGSSTASDRIEMKRFEDKFIIGETYTLSIKAKRMLHVQSLIVYVFCWDKDLNSLFTQDVYLALSEELETKQVSFTIPESTKYVVLTVNPRGFAGYYKEIDLEDIKIFKGTEAKRKVEIEGLDVSSQEIIEAFDYTKYNLPILYLEGDTTGISKENAVNMTYVWKDTNGTCTLKWQGSSSLNYDKKNFTIKFPEPKQIVESWGLQTKYVLKADYIDFSHARNVVGAKIWGDIYRSRTNKNATLVATPNCGAVDGFPIQVVINGVWQGIYNFNIPKDGWMMGMGNGSNEVIVCSDAYAFWDAPDFSTKLSLEYSSDNLTENEILNSLNNIIQLIESSTFTAENIENILSPYLDIESVIDYMLLTTSQLAKDNQQRNWLCATYDMVRWFFVPYDMDNTYGRNAWNENFDGVAESIMYSTRVGQLILNYRPDLVKARWAELKSGALSQIHVLTRFANYINEIPLELYIQDAKKWTHRPNTSMNNYAQISTWYMLNFEALDKIIEDL